MDTSKSPNETPLDDSLAFFGAITASVSHELSNVIAIMDQTTGLLEDRLAGAQEEIRITREKLETIVTSLQKQAMRGLDIIKRLNRFAHSTDHIRQTFDIGETLQNLIRLIGRLATTKGVTLETRLPATPIAIENNPFYLQQAVFAAVKAVLVHAQPGDVVTISLREHDHKAEMTVERPISASAAEDIEVAELTSVMHKLSGAYKIAREHERVAVCILVPV